MPTNTPTAKDIDVLLAFREALSAEDVQIYVGGGDEDGSSDGVIQMGSASYSDVVSDFFHAARAPVWVDKDYVSKQAGEILADPSRIASASIQDMKTLLTFCVRTERFCDGYWGDLIKGGKIKEILDRLVDLRKASE
jgi:hypothetical protein